MVKVRRNKIFYGKSYTSYETKLTHFDYLTAKKKIRDIINVLNHVNLIIKNQREYCSSIKLVFLSKPCHTLGQNSQKLLLLRKFQIVSDRVNIAI